MDANKLLARAGAFVLVVQVLFLLVIAAYLLTYVDQDTSDPKTEFWRYFPYSMLLIGAILPWIVSVYLFWKGRLWPEGSTAARRRFNALCVSAVLLGSSALVTDVLEGTSSQSDRTFELVLAVMSALVLAAAVPVIYKPRLRPGPAEPGPGDPRLAT
jgi:hypothetical protein